MFPPPAAPPAPSAPQTRADDDDTVVGFPPRRPGCLHRMEPESRGSAAVWVCSGCGLARIS